MRRTFPVLALLLVTAVPSAAQQLKLAFNDGLVTIVEFSEFQCPYCRRVEPALAELLQRFPNDVRIVFKHLPLGFHEHALPAARPEKARDGGSGDIRSGVDRCGQPQHERLEQVGRHAAAAARRRRKVRRSTSGGT